MTVKKLIKKTNFDDSDAKNIINMDKNKSPSRHLMYNYRSDK